MGIAVGITFSGPLAQMYKHLERNNFAHTLNTDLFGTIDYPVKSGPRTSLSISYSILGKSNREFGVVIHYADLGEIVGQNSSGDRVEAGFRNYSVGAFYQVGPRFIKFNVGPTLMINKAYSVRLEDFKEKKEVIDHKITAGLRGEVLLYIWNGRITYGTIGAHYSLSLPTEHGPFPINSSTPTNEELDKTDLNFGYGAVSFSFGLKF